MTVRNERKARLIVAQRALEARYALRQVTSRGVLRQVLEQEVRTSVLSDCEARLRALGEDPLRRCPRCGQDHPEEEGFGYRTTTHLRGGQRVRVRRVQSWCRECRSAGGAA